MKSYFVAGEDIKQVVDLRHVCIVNVQSLSAGLDNGQKIKFHSQKEAYLFASCFLEYLKERDKK